MKSIKAGWAGALVFSAVAAMLGGCSGDDATVVTGGERAADEIRQGDSLYSVRTISDFGNIVRIDGLAGMFEGTTTLGLFNHSQPGKKGILHDVGGGQMGMSHFTTEVNLGDYTIPGDMLAAPGDCISVANVGVGGRAEPVTLEEARRAKPFGAFAYANTDGIGNAHPFWAVSGPKVYNTVKECLEDPIRSWDGKGERLLEVTDPADFGHVVGLEGYVLYGEGEAHIELRQASNPGRDGNVGSVSIRNENPQSISSIEAFETSLQWKDPTGSSEYWSPENGECITAVSVHLFGKGGEKELGTFRWCHSSAATHPAGPECTGGIKLFDTAAACLAADR